MKSIRTNPRSGAPEGDERLIAALQDARAFAVSIERNEGRWENHAAGLVARIDAVLNQSGPTQGDMG